MYPRSARFDALVRNGGATSRRVEVWRGGTRIDNFGDNGIPVYGGEVAVDGSKLTRRILSGLRVDATDAMWDLLSPPGTRLHVHRGVGAELLPVGRFIVDDLTETYGGDWDGQVGAAPDLMVLVQRARFPAPREFSEGTSVLFALRTLVEEVLGPATVLATSRAVLSGPKTFERDRDKAVLELAQAAAADVFCAPDGTPMIVDTPQLGTSVWTVNPGDGGVLYSGTRGRSLRTSYSAVSASNNGVGGDAPYPPQVVYDDDPRSPTYYLGPFGLNTYFIASDLLATPEQALLAAKARLPLVTAARATLDVTAECHPGLDANDTITVVLPPRFGGQQQVVERHLIGSVTVPLGDGTQSITTKSAVADVEDSA